MRRADRILALAALLKGGALKRAEDLAGELEVSVRTVYRDIAALQANGLQIEGQAGVGYMLRGPIDLPSLAFSHDQLEALSLGLAYVEQVGDPDLALAAREARRKIDAVWRGASAAPETKIRLRTRQPETRRAPKAAGPLRAAIRARRVVKIGYVDADGARTAREIEPLSLLAFSEGWLAIAWCRKRRGFRVFRIDRIQALAVAEETFADHPERNLAAYFKQRAILGE